MTASQRQLRDWESQVPKNHQNSYNFFSPRRPPKSGGEQIDMRYKNNIGPQVRRRRYALGRSQSVLAMKLRQVVVKMLAFFVWRERPDVKKIRAT
jgi:hypothetical protein